MKRISRTIASTVFALALLTGLLGVSTQTAHALNDPSWAIIYKGLYVTSNGCTDTGSSLTSDVATNAYARTIHISGVIKGTCQTTGTLQIGFHTDLHRSGGGFPTYTSYWYEEMDNVTGGAMMYLASGASTTNFFASESSSANMCTASCAQDYGFMAQTTGSFSVKFRLTLSLDPVSAPGNILNVHVHLDDTNSTAASYYVARLGDYFDEINGFLIRGGVDKRLAWDGTVATHVNSQAEAWNLATAGCDYDSPTGRNHVEIWFNSQIHLFAYTYGRDCDGHATMEIDTSYGSTNFVPPEHDEVVEGDNDGFNGYWFYVSAILHELTHNFGAFIDELYEFERVGDATGERDDVTIAISNPHDKWWFRWGDYAYYGGDYALPYMATDVMRVGGALIGYSNAIEQQSMVVSSFTAKFLNTWDYIGRNHTNGIGNQTVDESVMTGSIHELGVHQHDANGNAAQGVHIKAWYLQVAKDRPAAAQRITANSTNGDYITNSSGYVAIPARPTTPDPSTGPDSTLNVIALKSYTVNNGIYTQYGLPQLVDIYQLEQYVFANGTGSSAYPVFMDRGRHVTGNVGVAGATVRFRRSGGGDGDDGSTTSEANGDYVVVVPDGWSGTIIPEKTGHYFAPASRSYTNLTSDEPSQSYTVPPSTWYIRNQSTVQWGLAGDIPMPGDYTGDGISDLAVFRPLNSTWYIKNLTTDQYGLSGDVPLHGDFNFDHLADVAVYRPSDSTWNVQGQASVQWGLPDDIPVPGDYNGDGRTDIAVFRPSNATWYIKDQSTTQWGLTGDIPVPADYTGDGRTDLAVFRSSNGTWYIQGQASIQYGLSGDVPVPADYNHDHRADIAVYRPSTSYWYVKDQYSTQWGLLDDIPVPADYDGNGTADIAVYRPVTP